jgi:hypothetical protein
VSVVLTLWPLVVHHGVRARLLINLGALLGRRPQARGGVGEAQVVRGCAGVRRGQPCLLAPPPPPPGDCCGALHIMDATGR